MSRDEESHGHQSDWNRNHACNDSQGGCGGDSVSKNVNHHLDKSDHKGESRNHQIFNFRSLLKSHDGMFSTGVRIMHQNRWFCDDLLQTLSQFHRLRHHHTVSARFPLTLPMGEATKNGPGPEGHHQSASLPNGHLGGHQKTIDLLRNHQIRTSKWPKLNGAKMAWQDN